MDIDLNPKPKTLKLLEETGEILCNFEVGKNTLDETQHEQL